jgi:hypothetical protein
VRQNIAVRVSHGAFVKGKFDAADDQFAAFRKPMKIVPNTAAHAHAL